MQAEIQSQTLSEDEKESMLRCIILLALLWLKQAQMVLYSF
jgi:hypothetical protein